MKGKPGTFWDTFLDSNREIGKKRKMRQLSKDFTTKAYSCRHQRGDLLTDAPSILRSWREKFCSLLNFRKSETTGYVQSEFPIDGD